MSRLITDLRYILLVGFLIRVLFAFTYDTGDTGAFCQASQFFLENKEVYANPAVFYSGPPFALHVTALSHFLADTFHLPCSGMWKMPTVFADIGIGYLIFRIARNHFNKNKGDAIRLVRWYIYNPVAIFIAGFHGQQDPFWLFFIILSYVCLKEQKPLFFAGLSAGIAVAYKLPAVFLILPLLWLIPSFTRKLVFLFFIGIFLFLSLFPEILTSTMAVIRQSFLYSSTPGIWGFSAIAKNIFSLFLSNTELAMLTISSLLKGVLVVVLGITYFLMYRTKRLDFFSSAVAIYAAFLVFTPGFGTQYLLWPLPFLILSQNRFLKLYTVFVTFAFLNNYGLSFPPLTLLIDLSIKYIYMPLRLSYPHDLFYPVWIVLWMVLLFQGKGSKAFIVQKLFGRESVAPDRGHK